MSKIRILMCCLVTAGAMAGCATTMIHVDQTNTQGPWDGSETHPYKSVQDGLNKAQAGKGEAVVVHGGVYSENVVMKLGTSLERAKGSTSVALIGKPGLPTIASKGQNYINGLIVDGGSVGIEIEIDSVLNSMPNALSIVSGNLLESTNAIHVKTGSNLAFPAGVRKKPWVVLEGNWIRPGVGASGGTAIRVELTGPKTGELALRMGVKDNIIAQKSTAIEFKATGQGPNPTGFVRAMILGEIANNLIFDGYTGIRLESVNLGNTGVMVFSNTIADNLSHAMIARATAGGDGDGSTHPSITNNIIVGNKGYGYLEFDQKTSALELNHNVFFNNAQGHYFDIDTGTSVNTQAALNTPIVQGKVVFFGGANNLVADPLSAAGVLPWNGLDWAGEKAGTYFLNQSAAKKSPAVDGGLGTALDGGLSQKTTSTNYAKDSGAADVGFHYTK